MNFAHFLLLFQDEPASTNLPWDSGRQSQLGRKKMLKLGKREDCFYWWLLLRILKVCRISSEHQDTLCIRQRGIIPTPPARHMLSGPQKIGHMFRKPQNVKLHQSKTANTPVFYIPCNPNLSGVKLKDTSIESSWLT